MENDFTSIKVEGHEKTFVTVFEQGRINRISVFKSCEKQRYFFNPTGDQQGITDELLKEVLTVMIGSNIAAFELIYTAFEKQEYRDIAQRVFKEHWNNLYNTVVADDVFGREISFSSICKVYDFFEEKE